MPAMSAGRLQPVGWAGDKPTAFNCGFMAAADPQLTLCLRGV